MQELLLPRSAVIKCGRHEINWHTIAQASKFLETHAYQSCRRFYESLSIEEFDDLKAFVDAVGLLISSWSDSQDQNERSDMIKILAGYRDREASDPRDKVYGFLSLCTLDVQESFKVDYCAELLDCYVWPTMHDIRKSGDLRVLGLAL